MMGKLESRYTILNQIKKGILSPSEGYERLKVLQSDIFYYSYAWEASTIKHMRVDQKNNEMNFLIFCSDKLMIKKIRANYNEGKYIFVVEGNQFTKTSDDVYMISSSDSSSYTQLFNQLSKQNFVPHNILHMWAIVDGQNSIQQKVQKSAISIIEIYKNISEIKEPVKLLYAFREPEWLLEPQYRSVGSIMKSLEDEASKVIH